MSAIPDLVEIIIEWIVAAIRGGKLTDEQRARLAAACAPLPVPGPAETVLADGNQHEGPQ